MSITSTRFHHCTKPIGIGVQLSTERITLLCNFELPEYKVYIRHLYIAKLTQESAG